MVEEAGAQQRRMEDELRALQRRVAELEAAQGELLEAAAEQARAEKLLRLQRDLGMALSEVKYLPQAFDRIMDILIQVEGIDSGAIYLVDGAAGGLELAAHRGLCGSYVATTAHFDAGSHNARLALAGEAVYVDNQVIQKMDFRERGETLRSLASLPIKHEGQVIAVIYLASHTLDTLPTATRHVLEAAANWLGAVIARLKAEDLLHDSEARYRALFEHSMDAILLTHPDGEITAANPAACAMLGRSEEEIIQAGRAGLVDPADPNLAVLVERRQRTGMYRGELVHLRKDGTRFLTDASSVIYPSGGEVCASVILRDITDRKLAETALQMQRDVSQALGSSNDLAGALNAVLEIVLRLEGIDCGGVYLENPRTGAFDLAVQRGLSEAFARGASHCEASSAVVTKAKAGQARYGLYRNIWDGSEVGLLAEGLRALAVIPILHDGKLAAIFNLASHTVDEIPAVVRQVLETTAAQIGGLLARLRADATLQQSRKNLELMFDTIDDILVVVDESGTILAANAAAEQQLGYTRQELMGMCAPDLHPAEQREEAARMVGEMLAGRVERFFLPLLARDGSLLPVETRVSMGEWDGRPALFGVSRDISQRLATEQALRESEEKYRVIFDNQIYGVAILDPQMLRFLDVNEAMERLYGYSREEFLHAVRVPDILIEPEGLAGIFERLLNEGTLFFPLRHHRKKDGTVFAVEIVGGAFTWKGRAAVFALTHDITDRKRVEAELEQSERRYREMIEGQAEGVFITDTEARFTYANPAAEALFGVIPGGLEGRDVRQFLTPDQALVIEQQLALRARNISNSYELRITRVDGETRDLLVTANPHLDSQQNHIGTIGICRDITRRKMDEENLRYASSHDALTGLHNRVAFNDAMRRTEVGGKFPVGVIMIDVDGLKQINDSLGHQAGDDLLRTTAGILMRSIRESDLAARIGGDEFVILLPSAGHDPLQQVVARIKKLLQDENSSSRHAFSISISIGSAVCEEPGSLDQAVHLADLDMYQVKRSKRVEQIR